MITVTWAPATDETGGQKDVEKYLVYRRTAAGSFSGAMDVVAAGQSSYSYADNKVLNDSTYYYQVTAVDCTPQESTPSISNSVAVPH